MNMLLAPLKFCTEIIFKLDNKRYTNLSMKFCLISPSEVCHALEPSTNQGFLCSSSERGTSRLHVQFV